MRDKTFQLLWDQLNIVLEISSLLPAWVRKRVVLNNTIDTFSS
jgi:hypothetical protein